MHLSELPDITDERYKPLWEMAVRRTAKCLQRTPTTDEIVAVYADLVPRFTESDGTVNLEKKAFVLPNLPYAYPEAPGLILRPLQPQDAEIIAPLMVYPELETSRRVAAIRAADPFTQTLAWEYRGRLVQTESLRWKPDGSVEIGMAVHCMPRTAEFWREIEKPVFERLKSMGITTMSTLTLNKLLPYWEPILHNFYHAKAGRVSPLTTHFTYPLDLAVFKGWPKRLTLGPDWKWTHEAAGLVVREMRQDELVTVSRDLVQSWGSETHPRLALSRQVLDEQWWLDRATVLVAHRGDEQVGVFILRPRSKPGLVHYAYATRDEAPEKDLLYRVIHRAAAEWAYDAGFTVMVGSVPPSVWNNPIFQRVAQQARWKMTRPFKLGRVDMVEIMRDLVAIHAEPQDAWDTLKTT